MSRRRKAPLPDSPSIAAAEARQRFDDCRWLDLRGPALVTQGIRSAQRVSHRHALSLLALATDRDTVLFCQDGAASRRAAAWLYAEGKPRVFWLQGGFEYWQRQYSDTLIEQARIPDFTSDGTD